MAGRQFAQVFLSPDYRRIDDYNRQVADASTGAFHDDFVSKEADLRQLVTKAHSVAQGNVLAAASRDVTAGTATLLVVADQSVQNKLSAGKSTVLRSRVIVRLQQVDGRWLVNGFEPVIAGGPGCVDRFAAGDSNDLLSQTCADIARLFSVDYRSLDWDIPAQRAVVTDQTLVSDMWSDEALSLARREHLSVTALVSDAAIEQQSPTAATLLVFPDQTVRNDALSVPRIDRNRLRVTMTKVDGRWLVSGLHAL
jgi:Mce-associated membrane protein